MADKYHQIAEELRGPPRELRSEIPDVLKGYSQLHAATMAEGVLSKKIKELMALAISVVNRCDGCISSHARAAAIQGASRDEVAEALGVAIMLSGGPGTVYAPRAFEAFLEYQESQ